MILPLSGRGRLVFLLLLAPFMGTLGRSSTNVRVLSEANIYTTLLANQPMVAYAFCQECPVPNNMPSSFDGVRSDVAERSEDV